MHFPSGLWLWCLFGVYWPESRPKTGQRSGLLSPPPLRSHGRRCSLLYLLLRDPAGGRPPPEERRTRSGDWRRCAGGCERRHNSNSLFMDPPYLIYSSLFGELFFLPQFSGAGFFLSIRLCVMPVIDAIEVRARSSNSELLIMTLYSPLDNSNSPLSLGTIT